MPFRFWHCFKSFSVGATKADPTRPCPCKFGVFQAIKKTTPFMVFKGAATGRVFLVSINAPFHAKPDATLIIRGGGSSFAFLNFSILDSSIIKGQVKRYPALNLKFIISQDCLFQIFAWLNQSFESFWRFPLS